MKQFVIILSLIISFASCSTAPKQDPKAELSNAYSSILSEQTAFNAKVEQAISKSDFNDLRTEGDSVLARSTRELDKIKALELPEEQAYKQAIQDAASAMIDIIQTGKKFGELTTASTEQEYNDLISSYQEQANNLPTKIEQVNKLKK